MNQEWVENASAAFLFYSSEFNSDLSQELFYQKILHAVMCGQLVYLTAVLHRIGVSCIGAFDQAEFKQRANIDDKDELLYVMVAGNDKGIDFKLDKENEAFHH